jgi:fructose-1,6-bisphosphatase/inositol monophosphatase family enzyme
MIGSEGACAQVIREVPRGHFREVLLSPDGSATQLRSFVPVGAPSVSGAVRVRFSRAHGYMGSSALSLATVGTGRVAAAALGGGYGMWDVAAGALIAREAGARLFTHDGTEAGPSDAPPLGGLLAATPGIADLLRDDLLAAIKAEG